MSNLINKGLVWLQVSFINKQKHLINCLKTGIRWAPDWLEHEPAATRALCWPPLVTPEDHSTSPELLVGMTALGPSREEKKAPTRALRLLLVSGVKLDISLWAENGNLCGDRSPHISGMLHGVMCLALPSELPPWTAAPWYSFSSSSRSFPSPSPVFTRPMKVRRRLAERHRGGSVRARFSSG